MVLVVTILFGGGYFFYIAQAVCPVPISYSVGYIDERFTITQDEARVAISEAESAWEDATGMNLFSYTEEGGKLTINFVYDERQEFVEAENELKDRLDATENISEAIGETYATLVAQYDELKRDHEEKIEEYEQKLSVYNAEVERYNNEGGAPPEVYQKLQTQKDALASQQRELNAISAKLNTLVGEINNVGERGNNLITSYNEEVNVYNETFGESHEFTQGDYRSDVIKIYTFEDDTELKLVLAHEFGHALSLDHAENEESVMYYLIGEQSRDLTITQEDLVEFNRVCGDISLFEKLQLIFKHN